MNQELSKKIDGLTDTLSCKNCPAANTSRGLNLPGPKAVIELLEDLISILFPGCHTHKPVENEGYETTFKDKLTSIAERLIDQISRVKEYACTELNCHDCFSCSQQAEQIVLEIFEELPAMRTMLQEDILAAYEGDPAAHSNMEIVMSYPGLFAIAVHRIAHALYRKKVHLLPRIMSEHAHSKTGIDIHPGAVIDAGFFIDHGTGVVIGETCVIGRHVKIYQGVTLGALSFAKDEKGRLIKDVKRHPNVEDNVIIYAGATILGGDTVIGHDSVIGGNVWLIHSVKPCSRVYNQPPTPLIESVCDGECCK